VPIYQKFYFFNVTNAADVEQLGHRPQLQEIGPFTYRTDWSKRDIDNDDLKSIITFKSFKQWYFEPELSIADHHLELVTLNAPLAITLSLIQNASNAIRLLVTFSLDGLSEGFFTRRSVKQLLFDGYPDLLTTFGPLLNAEMLSQGGHFGYMNARNQSQDGIFEVNTGQDDIYKLNTINKYNGRSRLPYWHNYHHSNHCNSLEGSTIGELFPPLSRDDDSEEEGDTVKSNSDEKSGAATPTAKVPSIKLFQPDFCRVWRLDQVDKMEMPNGLRLRRFRATRDVFKNSTELPANACFFAGKAAQAGRLGANQNRQNRPHTNRVGRQQQQASSSRPHGQHHHQHSKLRQEWPSGVFTLAPCKFNAPIYMSMPHFLDADPYYSSHLDGMAPDLSRHDFFVDLEPRTGSPVALAVRVQLNVAISKPPGLVRFRHVPEIMFPVFWQELSVNLSNSEPVLDQLLLASRGAQEANMRISYSFLILGIAILITTSVFYLHARALDSAASLGSLSSSSIVISGGGKTSASALDAGARQAKEIK